jgi:hypothetical protein
MWIFLVITTLSAEPPHYEFDPRAVTKTMAECMKLLETHAKPDANQQLYCVKAK